MKEIDTSLFSDEEIKELIKTEKREKQERDGGFNPCFSFGNIKETPRSIRRKAKRRKVKIKKIGQ